ncbi:putative delta-24-sterol methyltransferase [Cavenderia fasciculata]|uniref:Methyltransferase n=1 Tax=Cavenderia fasciculata TaxID=261658 RepID=F4Q8V0_CACFS|nr:putative delta-24-sterol methyltransferase [Cavenderia fasciculata]EGG15119.1 putative delta-24-sterol methyltransferase [Cavenderia fasciculata]|eukprot:XP_004351839.1 putative delta-24-sterol methyltransferase [Cavenderia fasciculata]
MNTQQRAMEGDLTRITAIARKEKDAVERTDMNDTLKQYTTLFEGDKASIESRKDNYTSMVNQFYDLASDYYEFGWGQSFHFATRHRFESFEASIARHEMYLAHQLGLFPGMRVLDVGCGVGGPMRTIARFSGAHVVGLNNNEYQIQRAKRLNEAAGLSHLCSFVKADFMHVPQADETYDAIYQVEATCHAPNKVDCYKEIYRLLKPGCLFGGYEWVMTNKYDKNNAEHNKIKHEIEVGNGLPDLEQPDVIVAALKEAGFEVLTAHDVAEDSELPWYLPLSASFSITGFLHTGVGRYLTGKFCQLLELVKIAPKGAYDVNVWLQSAATYLVAGGSKQIFSPMLFVLARKPEKKN